MNKTLIASFAITFFCSSSLFSAGNPDKGLKPVETQKVPAAGAEKKAAIEKKIPADSVLKTLEQKRLYMLGTDIGKTIYQYIQVLGMPVDTNALIYGIKDALNGADLRLSDDEMKEIADAMGEEIKEKQAKMISEEPIRNKQEGEKFLAKNKGKKGVVTTVSGLQYEVVKQGSGPRPKITDKVKVHYVGVLLNGNEFDNSIKNGKPVEFALNGVIPGWTEGVQLMPVGSKYKFYIPSKLAYGERGVPQGGIGPNSVLIFDVELLEIVQ